MNPTKLAPCFDWNFGACTASFNTGRERWTDAPFAGDIGTYFAKVAQRIPGNPRPVDVIALNRSGITARISNQIQFVPVATWSSQPFYGEAAPIPLFFRPIR